jgi:hypothetical protein
MNNEFEQIKNAVKHIKLDNTEKEKMRTFVFEKIQSAKFEQNNHVINTIVARLYRYYQGLKNYYFMNNKYKFVPAIAMFLVAILVGGTSTFAEMAVPGDLLYGVKVSVNEPVAGLFAFTKEEQTVWRERLVERRLNEAQKLVSSNSLDTENRVYLEDAIQKQIDDFNASADELSKEKDESNKSSDINIRLQAALSAHQDVLLAVLDGEDADTETRLETSQLLIALAQSQNRVRNSYDDLDSLTDTETTITSSTEDTSTTPVDVVLAQEKQAKALNALSSMKLLFQKERNNLSINIQNEIENKLAEIETAIKDGDALIVSSDFKEAVDKFQSAVSMTDSARFLLLASVIRGDIEDDMDIEIEDEDEYEDEIEDGDYEEDDDIEEEDDVEDDDDEEEMGSNRNEYGSNKSDDDDFEQEDSEIEHD